MNTLIKQEAERILEKHTGNVFGFHKLTEWHRKFILAAMEEYAQSLQRPGWVKEVRSFVEGLVSGYDCENDFHKYQNGIGCRVCDAKKILKLMDEGGSDGWISVGGYELPNIGEWVLLYNGYWTGVGKRNRIEEGDHEEKMWEDETQEYITPSPTHFMPLPSPPKQQTK
jgi:hypothetical protein